MLEAPKFNLNIEYTGVEKYPITTEELKQLNYIEELKADSFTDDFLKLHESPWEEKNQINDVFSVRKEQKDFENLDYKEKFNLIYFDAFGARVQPELWTEVIFAKMYAALQDEGVLVTYSAKGSVRRAMQTVGFVVERLEGPPGKREMLRATKTKDIGF